MSPLANTRLELVRSALGAEYDVLRPLGEGGMGAVYLARERALQRMVAIKVLDPDLGASPVFRARFEREAQTAALLTHPNIVPIYRVGTAGPLAYFVMQWVEGPSLAERMRGAGRLPLADALRGARDVAAALGAAHRRGVIHRDVKPQNILIDAESGRCMVTDFGIASVGGAADRSAGSAEPLTGAGMVMGTPRYMSPEQATGTRDLTPASDFYALGVILYEMLAGAFPYKLGEPPNFMLAHLTQAVIPLVTRIGDMPREVESLVAQLLAKEPGDRPAGADGLVADLEALIGEVSGAAPTPQRKLRLARLRRSGGWLRQRWRMAVGAGVTVGLLAAMVPMALRARSTAPTGADARRSVLLGFFQNATPDRGLDWLRIGGVEYLAQSLSRWPELRVVDPERLLDLARRADLREGEPLSQDDALTLARRAGVWTATVGSVIKMEDSLRLTLRVYDVRTRALANTLQAAAATEDELPAAFGRLAADVLELAGAPASVRDAADPPTRSVTAYKAFIEGIAARSRWDLADAVVAFQRATREDGTFALAYYELSQALGAQGDIFRSERTFAYADTAVLRSTTRPEREQLLLRGYQRFLRGDLAGAKELYGQVLARDSTVVDALVGMGDVLLLDRTLVPDGRGGLRIPADPTASLRYFRKALTLDANDHRTYASLVDLLANAGEPNARIVAYREPPPGNFATFFLRAPATAYVALLRRDSILLVPEDSLHQRFRPAVVDSLRREARREASAVLAQWLARAPEEGQPYQVRAQLRVLDRDFDGALADLEASRRRGVVAAASIPVERLGVLLLARRLREATVLADSLAAAPRDSTLLPFAGGPATAVLALRGREGAALAGIDRQFAELRKQTPTPDLVRRLEVSELVRPLRFAAITGRLTQQQVRAAASGVEALVAQASDSQRVELRTWAARSLAFAAASVGDTTTAREWQRGAPGIEYSVEIAAWAAANAGDLKGASRVLAALPSDTVRTPTRLFARAETEIALGRAGQALRTLARLDSADVGLAAARASDWTMVAVALLRRAQLREAAGEIAGALADYRLFAELWAGADAPLQPIRRQALERIAALARLDTGGARGTPLVTPSGAPARAPAPTAPPAPPRPAPTRP